MFKSTFQSLFVFSIFVVGSNLVSDLSGFESYPFVIFVQTSIIEEYTCLLFLSLNNLSFEHLVCLHTMFLPLAEIVPVIQIVPRAFRWAANKRLCSRIFGRKKVINSAFFSPFTSLEPFYWLFRLCVNRARVFLVAPSDLIRLKPPWGG